MNEKWVACLGAGESQISLIKNSQLLGYKVLAIDRNPKAPGFAFSDESLVESTHDSDKIIENLKGINLCGLLARSTGSALFTAASIVEKYKVAGINYELANIATSKSALREFCVVNNIKVPRGVRVSNFKDFNDNEFSGPIIVKPDFTIVGKESITKIDSSASHEVNKSIELALLSSGNEFVEIEDFIEGYDCSYLSWIENGSSSILLSWDELIGFDESSKLFQFGISAPSISLTTSQHKQIEKIIDSFSNLFPDVCAILSFSFRVDTKGIPWLIEVHADMTGDMILDGLAPEATGFDFLLEITKLLICGKINSYDKLQGDFSIKPTALIYKTKSQYEYEILTADDIFTLHDKVSDFVNLISVEQKLVLDKIS
jgi:hypothetical protein